MKKLFFLHIAFCMALSVVAKEGFTTTFDITGITDTVSFEIRIHDSEKGFADWRFDTIQVVNGHGVLTDVSTVKYPVQAFAFTPYGTIDFFIGNNENERISGSIEDIENLTLKFEGTPWSEELMEFNRNIESPTMRIYQRMSKGALSAEEKDSIRNEGKAIEQ